MKGTTYHFCTQSGSRILHTQSAMIVDAQAVMNGPSNLEIVPTEVCEEVCDVILSGTIFSFVLPPAWLFQKLRKTIEVLGSGKL